VSATPDTPLLSVRHLAVELGSDAHRVEPVADVSFDVFPRDALGIVGPSGAGKTLTAHALLGILPEPARVRGEIELRGRSLLDRSEAELERIRGRDLALVFQDPSTAFDPVATIGAQVAEAVRVHQDLPAPQVDDRVLHLLGLVGMADPRARAAQYPHELSGGLRQRAMLAVALANDPAVLIADEPTSNLDAIAQAQVLDVLARIREETNTALVLITHDLGVIARAVDRVLVVEAGRDVETAPVDELFTAPRHPCTRSLLAAVPRLDGPGRGGAARGAGGTPVLAAEGLVKEFPVRAGMFRRVVGHVAAVADVSFTVRPGETLALVGESGSGKTTTARLALRLLEPSAGRVRFRDEDLTAASPRRLRALRRHVQIVFQDPAASLNPRLSVYETIADPLRVHRVPRADERRRVGDLLELVGLRPEQASHGPHQLSGGERQRVGIARALALEPQLLVLDEPVSALDTPNRAAVVELLEGLQRELGVAYLFIAHDLGIVRRVADRVAVMYLGRIVETAPAAALYDTPAHPYTQALLSATPVPDPPRERARRRIILAGDPPHPGDPPSGCRFRTRCWKAQAECAATEPELVDRGRGHLVACHFPEPEA